MNPFKNRETIKEKIMKYLMLIPVFCLFFQISGSHALSPDSMDLSSGCDKAIHVFWKGRLEPDKDQARQYYQEAIELCLG